MDSTTDTYRLENLEGGKSISFSPKSDVSIGRDPSTCTVVFQDAGTLSRIHCRIFSLGADVFLKDTSSNGTFVNGKVVGRGSQRVLRTGDLISLVNPQLPESPQYSWRFLNLAEATATSTSSSTQSEMEKLYDLGPVLGTGNFATVRLGTHRKTGQRVAIKIIEKKRFALSQSDFSFTSLLSEVDILRKMNHKHIIGVVDVFDDPKTFTMILELVSGGDFFDYIVGRGSNPFSEAEAKLLFVQLLEAMLYMHSKDVVHRDLKPENILVQVDQTFTIPHKTDDHQRNAQHIPPARVMLKITDFGLAKFCTEHDVMTTMCGTPSYLAPEVLLADPLKATGKKPAGYSWSVDVWSLGVILYIMLSGCPPKDPQNGEVVFNKFMTDLSKEAKDLIVQMLKVDARERADLNDICNHAWLAGVKIEGRALAHKVDRLQLCGTMLLVPKSTVRVEPPSGDATDVESDDDGSSPKKKRKLETVPEKRSIIVWMWKKELGLDDGAPNAWQAYSDEDSSRIEKAKARGALSAKVGNTNDYRISFEGMFQYSAADPTKQRPVKRSEI